jgi:hypothetical protein
MPRPGTRKPALPSPGQARPPPQPIPPHGAVVVPPWMPSTALHRPANHTACCCVATGGNDPLMQAPRRSVLGCSPCCLRAVPGVPLRAWPASRPAPPRELLLSVCGPYCNCNCTVRKYQLYVASTTDYGPCYNYCTYKTYCTKVPL